MAGLEALLMGRVLADRYRIEEVIGRGGMGAVYRATDERLGRQVAVKVITVGGGADAETRERIRQRFLREARAAAALPHHPNVVPVYDYGTDPALGLDFLVMELLRGEDLASRMANAGPPPLSVSIRILHEAARGLAIGHRAQLVHRDIKPGNIFLAHDEHEDFQVRVLDFGIAKLATEEDTLNQLTQDGRAPLSPTYASPEQLRGLTQIAPASDVFSLGAVGFQLLTGQRPFSDSDRNRMSIGMPVPVPSLREYNPAVPPSIDEVIRRALAFEPEDRFADASAFARTLDQARREIGEAPLPPYMAVPPVAEPEYARAEPQDDRTEFMDGPAAPVDDRTLLDPDSARQPPPARPTTPRREPLPLPPRPRREERQGMHPFVSVLLALLLLGAGAVVAWVIMEQRPTTTAEIPPPPDEIPEIVMEEPVEEEQPPGELDAFINNQEGARLFRQNDFQAAAENFRRAVEISPENPEYRYNYALALLRLGQVQEAVQHFTRVTRQDPQRAGAHFYLAEAQVIQGDTAAAIASLQRVLEVSTDPRQQGIAERQMRDGA